MMRQMRANTKWIMLVTAMAFVLLMVFQWGMDITGRTSGSLGEIGRVNGTPVQYEAYMGAYRNLYDQTQIGQADPISTQQNRELEQAAWDQMVDGILIRQELDRRGIDVTDEEIRQAARFQPPAEFRENPAFLTEGNFDLVKYQQFLANSADPQLFLQLEAYYREVLPQGKLMRQVATGVFITDAELWERYRDVHETTLVRFVPLNPAQRVPDDSVTVTDAEMERYWEDHQDEFEVPARASVKLIALPKAPTAADSAAANLRAVALLDEIRAGASFDSVGNREAAAVQPVTFQDLGTFGRDAMTPAFDTAAFTAPVGRATGPLRTSFGYHLLLVSKRTGDSATAKHILVPITRTEESETAILMLADSTENLAEDLTLEEVGRIMGFEVVTGELSDAFPVPPRGRNGLGRRRLGVSGRRAGRRERGLRKRPGLLCARANLEHTRGCDAARPGKTHHPRRAAAREEAHSGDRGGPALGRAGQVRRDPLRRCRRDGPPGARSRPIHPAGLCSRLGAEERRDWNRVRSCDRQRERPRPHAGERLRDGEDGPDAGRLDPVDGTETGAAASTDWAHPATAPPGLDLGSEDRSQNYRPARRGSQAPG